MTPEQHVAQFLKELNKDLNKEGLLKKNSKFLIYWGLCANLTTYCYRGNLSFEECLLVEAYFKRLIDHLGPYPFNKTSGEFFYECGHKTLYLNPQRLAFINQHKAK